MEINNSNKIHSRRTFLNKKNKEYILPKIDFIIYKPSTTRLKKKRLIPRKVNNNALRKHYFFFSYKDANLWIFFGKPQKIKTLKKSIAFQSKYQR